MLSFLLSSVHAAVHSEPDPFFANLCNRADSVRKVTAQAFYQARSKISALVFGEVNQHLMGMVEEHLPIPRWRGLHVVAADGSAVRLTMMKENVRSIVTGMAFGLYLPGIELSPNFRLHEPLSDERQMFFEAIGCLRSDDVLLMDRCFPCRWLVSTVTACHIPICIRCDLSQGCRVVHEVLKSGRSEQVVVLRAPNARDAQYYECPAAPTTVRLARVVTPNGRVHVVMASLLDPLTFPAGAFADLDPGRWRIEEAFKLIKHRLRLEHTSGLSWHAARQDFGAKAGFDNLNALAAYVATNALLDPASSYKIKRQIGRWLLAATATAPRLTPLLEEIALTL